MKKNNTTFKRDNFKLGLINLSDTIGQYNFPIVKTTQSIVSKYQLIPFNMAKTCTERHKYFVHFYIDDYQFERVWQTPEKYLSLLKDFKGVIAPDFSLYVDMPKAMQIWNCYKSRVLTYYWQQNGLNVIPNATWANEDSFAWCFDGLPKQSTIAVSSVGCMKNIKATLNFCIGYKKMIEVLQPTTILFYGEIPRSLQNEKNIIKIVTQAQKKFNFKEENKWAVEEVVI